MRTLNDLQTIDFNVKSLPEGVAAETGGMLPCDFCWIPRSARAGSCINIPF
jgi:hypothetical protein